MTSISYLNKDMKLDLALEKLQKDAKSKAIQDSIIIALKHVKESKNPDSITQTLVWAPFKLACMPRNNPHIRITALDLIQKLIAHKIIDGSEWLEGDEEDKEAQKSSYPPMLIDGIVHSICTAAPSNSFINESSGQSSETAVHLQIIKALLTVVASESCEVHEASLMKCLQACVNIYLYSRNPTNQITAKAGLTQICHHIFSQCAIESMEKLKSPNVRSPTDLKGESLPVISIPSCSRDNNPYNLSEELKSNLNERDAFLTLKFLCKLAMKTDKKADDDESSTSVGELPDLLMNARALGLEMVFSLLNNMDHIIHTSRSLSNLVKTQVTLCISKNGLLLSDSVFEYAISLFVLLLSSYRSISKAEIEVLFNEIYFYILNNPNASRNQKITVLRAFGKVCANPQLLVDLYVNYDCDLDALNIFESLIESLEEICQGSDTSVLFAKEENQLISIAKIQDRKLKISAFHNLLTVLSSIEQWLQESYDGISAATIVKDHLDKSRGPASNGYLSEESINADDVTSPPPPSNLIISKNPLDSVGLGNESTVGPYAEAHGPSQDFEEAKSKKQNFRTGISMFNKSPKRGISFFKQLGKIGNEYDIVDFLRNTLELKKSAVGDYIGDGSSESVKILHLFVDSFDFRQEDFVTSLRRFLQSFRLPGEAQKIDRIMEKFAARYCENNPKIFANADVAYTLAFSIMMLNTDQHSSRIKTRMTSADFVRNNRGINNDADLPDEFLQKIFTDISENEIVLEEERTRKELEKMTSVNLGFANQEIEKQKRELYKKELKNTEKKSTSLLKRQADRTMKPFKYAIHCDHAKSMFELVFDPIASMSLLLLENCVVDQRLEIYNDAPVALGQVISNNEIFRLAYLALKKLISVFNEMKFEIDCDDLINRISKLSGIKESKKQLEAKNLASLNLLLLAATTLGNRLHNSWVEIFETISLIDRLQQLPSDVNSGRSISPTMIKTFQTQEITIAIDKIFTNSQKLEGKTILEFYKDLCSVASTEIQESRNYLTQKIVEISYYNMGRIRLEWTQIMKILAEFFDEVGSSSQEAAATYAVDSLRQLAMKFLERDELAHFHTNSEFLRPFEHISRKSPFLSVKELIIQSVSQMINARSANIKSGWSSIFNILKNIVSFSTVESINFRAFEILREALNGHQEQSQKNVVDYVSCISSFALAPWSDDNIKFQSVPECCLIFLGETADYLISMESEKKVLTDDAFHLQWFPLLDALSRICQEEISQKIRTKALGIMFDITRNNGHLFSFENGHWNSVIKTIFLPMLENLNFPLMVDDDEMHLQNLDKYASSKSISMWMQSIQGISETVSLYLEPRSGDEGFSKHLDLMKILFDLFVALVKWPSENLSSTGLIYYSRFLQNNWKNFDKGCLDLATDALESLFKATSPVGLMLHSREELLQIKGQEKNHLKLEVVKCAAHLLYLQMIKELCLVSSDRSHKLLTGSHDLELENNPFKVDELSKTNSQNPSAFFLSLESSQKSRWFSCLHASFVVAKRFNSDKDLRQTLWKVGIVPQMPNLIKQETLAISAYVILLLRIYASSIETLDEQAKETKWVSSLLRPLDIEYRFTEKIHEPLFEECNAIMSKYIELLGDKQRNSREITQMSSIVRVIWFEFSELDWGYKNGDEKDIWAQVHLFKLNIPKYYDFALSILQLDDSDMRNYACLYLKKIGGYVRSDKFLELVR